jgi:phage shock protein A
MSSMNVLDLFRKRLRYFTAKTNSRFEERADPKIQLEQAIAEVQDQHRRLVEQAANVVANHKQHELQLNRALEEIEKMNLSTRQALTMAQQAEQAGDMAKANEYNQTAEAFANRLVAAENHVSELKTLSLQSAQAADQARTAVQQNALALQQKLAERQKLMSQLDQAKMQEQLNKAMSSLSDTVDQTAPSLDQVRNKIEARYAKAIGTSELTGQTVESRMLEVQQAALGSEAKSRLDAIRAQMLGPSQPATGELSGQPGTAALGTGAPERLEAGIPAPSQTQAQPDAPKVDVPPPA